MCRAVPSEEAVVFCGLWRYFCPHFLLVAGAERMLVVPCWSRSPQHQFQAIPTSTPSLHTHPTLLKWFPGNTKLKLKSAEGVEHEPHTESFADVNNSSKLRWIFSEHVRTAQPATRRVVEGAK